MSNTFSPLRWDERFVPPSLECEFSRDRMPVAYDALGALAWCADLGAVRLLRVVLPQQVASEVILEVAPDRVNVIRG